MTDLDQSTTSSPVHRWGFWATLGWSMAIFGLFIASQTFVLIVAVAVVTQQHPEMDPTHFTQQVANSGLMLSVATLVSTPICMGAIAFLIDWRQGVGIKRYLELNRPNGRSLFLWCGATVVLIHGLDYLKSFVDRPPSSFTVDMYNTAQFLPLLYLAVGVAAPLFEEFFFRGFLFQGLSDSKIGPWGAILISSGFWAVIHLQYDFYDMGGIFVFGLILAIAQWRTRSLYIPIAMHSLNNFIALAQAAHS